MFANATTTYHSLLSLPSLLLVTWRDWAIARLGVLIYLYVGEHPRFYLVFPWSTLAAIPETPLVYWLCRLGTKRVSTAHLLQISAPLMRFVHLRIPGRIFIKLPHHRLSGVDKVKFSRSALFLPLPMAQIHSSWNVPYGVVAVRMLGLRLANAASAYF